MADGFDPIKSAQDLWDRIAVAAGDPVIPREPEPRVTDEVALPLIETALRIADTDAYERGLKEGGGARDDTGDPNCERELAALKREMAGCVSDKEVAEKQLVVLTEHVEALEKELLDAENQLGEATTALVQVRRAANGYLRGRRRP